MLRQRKQLLQDMVPGLEAEVHQALEGVATAEGLVTVSRWLKEALEEVAATSLHSTIYLA